jgi:hypothetical protein
MLCRSHKAAFIMYNAEGGGGGRLFQEGSQILIETRGNDKTLSEKKGEMRYFFKA